MAKRAFKRVFKEIRYAVGAVGIVFLAMSGALLLPNLAVIKQVFGSGSIDFGEKMAFLLSLYSTLFSNNTVVSGVILVLTAILFGINIGLLIYYIRRRQEKIGDKKAHLASLGGVVSAILGLGCAACGSVVLTAVFGLLGASSLVLLLPFHGAEFGILGIVLLLVSIRFLIKKINDPLVCPI